ncbi:MAG: Ig-like domain-containing protein, partial [Myxococcales bacterium]
GQTAQLAAVASDARGNPVSGASFSWRSDATGFVTVNSSGVVTAVANGSANVFARTGAVESPAFPVAVAQAVESVAVSGSSTVDVGATTQLSAAAFDANAHPVAGVAFAWSVQDASTDVLTVDSSGLVTGVSAGQKAVVASGGGKSGSLLVTARQVPVSVTVSGSSAPLASIGATVQLGATALDAGGNPIASATFTWRSDNAAAATVSGTGLVTAVANGTANIFAKAGNGVESTGFAVTVAQAVHSVSVSPPSASINTVSLTTSVTFSATALDANQHPVAGAPAASWQSSDTNVAVIDSSGTASSRGAGTATITATIATVPGTAQLTVIAY